MIAQELLVPRPPVAEQVERKLAAIVAADIVGFSRLTGADEERTLARLRALRGDLIDPAISIHRGRVVKGTGDGFIAEFRSAVAAVRCAAEIQAAMVERNAGVPPDRRITFRIGVHVGDVVEEADGDLMGDGVNIAARLEGIAKPGGVFLSEDAYRHVRARIDVPMRDLGPTHLKNIAEKMRVYELALGARAGVRRHSSVLALVPAFETIAAVAIAGAIVWHYSSGEPLVASNAPEVMASAPAATEPRPLPPPVVEPAAEAPANALKGPPPLPPVRSATPAPAPHAARAATLARPAPPATEQTADARSSAAAVNTLRASCGKWTAVSDNTGQRDFQLCDFPVLDQRGAEPPAAKIAAAGSAPYSCGIWTWQTDNSGQRDFQRCQRP